jgi:hypothetical protein
MKAKVPAKVPGEVPATISCERIIERLVDGARAADDAELGAHLSSCLRCYRAAADLRDLPQVTDLLHEARSALDRQGSPGEAFWRSFPATLGAAWDSARAAAPAPISSSTTDRPRRAASGLRAWLRRPMPAAFAGAACAAAVAFILVRPLRQSPGIATPSPEASLAAALQANDGYSEGMVGMALEDVPLPRSQGLDDSVRDLDAASLGVLLEGLDRELGSSAAADPDLDMADVAAVSGKLEDHLDDLEVEGLEALREGLGRSI